jgi:hypothetical protein
MKKALSSGLTHGLFSALLLAVSTAALAKLPGLSDEAKAKAAETAAKTAWTAKNDNFLLCKAQDRVAASYYKTAAATGKPTKPAATVAPCADPGVFAYVPPEAAKPAEAAKPVEAAGAHSPTATAASPPSGKQADAVVNPAKKP